MLPKPVRSHQHGIGRDERDRLATTRMHLTPAVIAIALQGPMPPIPPGFIPPEAVGIIQSFFVTIVVTVYFFALKTAVSLLGGALKKSWKTHTLLGVAVAGLICMMYGRFVLLTPPPSRASGTERGEFAQPRAA